MGRSKGEDVMTYTVDQAKTRLATSFGYQEIRPEDKQKMVEDLFGRVATRYDLMNDLMSGGIHRLWKAAMIDQLAPQPGMHLVDVAGGTGDIAFRVLDRLKARRAKAAIGAGLRCQSRHARGRTGSGN